MGKNVMIVDKLRQAASKGNRTAQYVADLLSSECPHCGGQKKARHSFCLSCYRKLPGDIAGALWCPIGGGYEGAFDRAMLWLATRL